MSDDGFDTPRRDSEQDATLQASAYLDNEATADVRTLVETSPDALAEVQRLGDVRTVLAGTTPIPSLSERENHLATALDVWERTSGVERGAEATPAGGVGGAATRALSTRRASKRKRARQGSGDGFGASQWLLSAAAVLVVVAGGAAIVRGILADDGVETNVALEATEAAPPGVEDLDALEAAEVEGENVGGDAILPQEQIEGEAFEDGRAESGAFETEMDDGVMDESTATAEIAADDVPDEAVQPAPAPEEDLAELTTRLDLAEFGNLVIPAIGNSPVTLPETDAEQAFESCAARLDIDAIAGFASYQGTPVTVGVDLDDDLVIAYVDDAITGGDCEVVETAPLPDPDASNQP